MTLYLDWNATTPPLAAVIDAIAAASRDAWGNPSSVHRDGSRARHHVEAARAQVAALFGVDTREVLFTSGGTEANNLAIRSALSRPGRLLLTELEHASVTEVAKSLPKERVRFVRSTPDGTIALDDLRAALQEGPTALVSLQTANHETGVLHDVGAVLDLLRDNAIPLHSDTVQAVGKGVPLWPEACYRVLAAHKIRGPKGIGALVTKQGTPVLALMQGGAQERGLRPGTVDPAACAGLAVAAGACANVNNYARIAALRDTLEARALACAPKGSVIAGKALVRMPHIFNMVMPGVSAPELVAALDLEGVSVSAGSACSAGTVEPSPVLRAMFGEALAGSGVRVSMGPETTAEHIEHAARVFEKVLARF
jgi:cysteine desulfurase